MAGGKPVLIPLRLVSMAMCLVCIPKYNLKQPAKNNITYSVQHIIKLLTREKRKFTVRKMCCASTFQKSGKKTITSADWFLDPDELAGKFNSKTKAIIINTPNNPIGKVSTQLSYLSLCLKKPLRR